MQHLSVDIETYSSIDIKASGMYKYVQSSDFEILLFAYSADGQPVQVIDFTKGEQIPSEIKAALFDERVIKHAYNAAFEWYALSKFYLGGDTSAKIQWLKQWHCTMVHGLYCGYTAGLSAAGKALGLPDDKQKMAVGNALIKLFCSPCAPTQRNGGRTRNLPAHEPEKWELFKEYNRQDVVTEMEIERRLSAFPVPDFIQSQWVTDQSINLRGVALDTELINGALICRAQEEQELKAQAAAITHLENPNSNKQLLSWLESQGIHSDALTKKAVEDLLAGDIPEHVKKVLKIRQVLSKSSIKKYTTMIECMCDDGRARGLLQFYGANRTGRWGGRFIQPQNLPRTYITDLLPLARDLAKKGRADLIKMVFGKVSDTLSQLIRTAIVAGDGKLYVDADFSAIEARVIAWLAQEQWRIDVFKTHGKIYEASASQMFGVPIERIKKGNPEYALRQKGKVAELALGYGAGPPGLVNMGALSMGLTEEELPDIVQRWRGSNKRICDLWKKVENAAKQAIRTGRPSVANGIIFAREADMQNGLDFLTVELPSKRKLYYAHPHLGKNRWGGESIHYFGMNQQSKKWQTVDTYGGKLVENIIQAIARDCLAENIERLERAGYQIAFHIHDEIVAEVDKDKADLDEVCKIMSRPISWAEGLPLNADGYVSEYFKKE